MLGFSRREQEYLHPHRLADVLALIQVLALDDATHRSEEGLRSELEAGPRSGKSWTEMAKEHPEFFRVKPSGDHRVSLISRHVRKREADTQNHPALDGAHVDSLLAAAIELHDRQVRRSERWTYLIPIWVALIVGVLGLAAETIK